MEKQYEKHEIEIRPADVQQGDYSINWGVVTTKPKVGTKWVTFEAEDSTGSRLVKLARSEPVKVYRKFETEASKERRRRVDANEALRSFAAKQLADPGDPLQVFIVAHEQWGAANYHNLSGLLEQEARGRVERRFQSVLRRALEENSGVDLVPVKDEFARDLRDSLLRYYRPTSRSTSVLENVISDYDREAIARFTEDVEWIVLRGGR